MTKKRDIPEETYDLIEELAGELTDDELEEGLQQLAQEFLSELTILCNTYGFEFNICLDCPSITIQVSDGLLDKYVLNGNHIEVKHIELVKAA